MSVYNAVQVIVNLVLEYYIVRLMIDVKFDFKCQPVNYLDNILGRNEMIVVYSYYLVKLLDFLDTVCLSTSWICKLLLKLCVSFRFSLFCGKNTIK